MLLARSDPDVPKHKGLTVFWLDMKTPGVEVRPIRMMSGDNELNEVFLTDVRIPDSQRVVVTLRDVAGWGSDEVCDTLGLTEGNQRVLLHRGRAKLRAALEQYLEED